MSHAVQSERIEHHSRYDLLICTGFAIGLAYLFWSPLWHGGGLIGGDIYSYFLPQKQYLAEHLQQGEFPLWNNRSGHGYPLIAESQTAAYYPPNLLAYRIWDVNTAYNAIQVAHYIFAFIGVWFYARKLGLTFFARALCATVFTYGWFPPRISLEWAIVTGAWLPWLLFFTERFALSRKTGDAAWITLALTFQLLAGHYNLAFASILLTVVYGSSRLLCANAADETTGRLVNIWRIFRGVRFQLARIMDRKLEAYATCSLLIAMVCAFGIASFKLWPTYELTQISQRSTEQSNSIDTGYGHIPLVYLTQTVAPWSWYGHDVDLNSITAEGSSPTNVIEAHLYFGLAPLAIVLWATFFRSLLTDRRCLIWAVIGAAALLVATGLLQSLTDNMPGFRYFRGAGRYGIVTTISVATIAGIAFDRIFVRSGRLRTTAGVLLISVTIGDLWLVSRSVSDATVLEVPVLNYVDDSPVKQHLAEYSGVARLFSPGPNLPNLLGVASAPPYLGLAPSVYFDESTYPPIDLSAAPTPEVISWMRRAGVTHILSFHELDQAAWPVERLWSGLDPFLNRAWGRLNPPEPFFLYKLHGSRGRIAWWDDEKVQSANGSLEIKTYKSDLVVAECDAEKSGRVVLTDLAYPGWNVYVDGRRAETVLADGIYRSVNVSAGEHQIEWKFEPSWGFVESMSLSLAIAAVFACLRWLCARQT